MVCGQKWQYVQQRDRVFFYFASVFFVLGFLQVWFALVQYYSLYTFRGFLMVTEGHPFGNLRQPNNFASVLVLCFFSGWYLFERRHFSRKVFYGWGFFIIIGLVLAQSRTTMLVGIFTCVFCALFKSRLSLRTHYGDILWILMCYLGLWFLLPEIKQWLSVQEGAGSLREIATSGNMRLVIWYESLLAIWQGPLWGYGWNQIGVAQALVNSPVESAVHFRQAHNLLLDLLLYNGPVLGGVMVLGILWIIIKAFRDCCTIEGWFILVMIGAIFTHAMLEFPLHYAYFLLPTAFLLGVIDSSDTKQDKKEIVSLRRPAWYLLPIILIAAVVLTLIWRDYNIIRKEHFKLDLELTGMFARKPETEITNDILLLTQRREHLHFGRAEVTENMSDTDIEWMRQVSHRFASPYYLSKYAKACQLNDRYDEDSRVLAVIKRLFGEGMYQYAQNHIYEDLDND